MVECGKTCFVIYMSLMLMTAGFVLTLTGWFAPPLNNFVLTVRMGGPITLLVGFVLLICSCFMCAIEQGKCCLCCWCPRPSEGEGPLIIASDHVTETQVDSLAGVVQRSHDDDDDDDDAVIVVNKSVAKNVNSSKDKQQSPSPSSFPKGYQPIPTCDSYKRFHERKEPLPRNGIVIQNVVTSSDKQCQQQQQKQQHQTCDNQTKQASKWKKLPNVCPLPSQTNEGYTLKQSVSSGDFNSQSVSSKTLMASAQWRRPCDQPGSSVCCHPHQSPCPLTPKTRKQRSLPTRSESGQDIDKVTRWNPESPLHKRKAEESGVYMSSKCTDAYFNLSSTDHNI